ncbi:MAG: GNAT family N-acetyltransferase [Parachlamydiales bacterium]|jgi:GNAT superfamily N-acetyltransferase
MELTSKNITLEQLVKFVEDNQVMFWSQLDVELHYDAYETKLITGIPHPLFNGVLRSQYPSKNITEQLEMTIEHFKRRKVPFTWWISQRSTPKDLNKKLIQKNLLHIGVMPTMIGILNKEHETAVERADFLIRLVEDDSTIVEWGKVVAQSFDIEGESITRYCQFFPKIGSTTQLQHYIGYYKGMPVAAATLFLNESTGGLYSVCVLPEFRCQGLGTHLVKTLLAHAYKNKCKLIAMQSYPIVVESCQKLGFVRICDYNVFISPEI